MASPTRPRHEAAHARLRADIVSGRWASGERLPFAALCREYTASVGVIREALVRLVEQGLVTSHPQQGFFVVETSPQDLLDIAEVRAEVESLAVRRATESGGLEWESEVVAAHHRLANTPTIDPNTEDYSRLWVASHLEFHSTILRGLENRRLWTSVQQLRNMAELYTRWLPAARSELAEAMLSEHQEIVDAIVARDVDRVSAVTRQHILRQATELSRSMIAAGVGVATES